VAKELCERIEKSRPEFNGQPIRVTASAGVTTYRKGESCECLIARADALLYQAKAEGRNRVCSEDDASEPVTPE
jgi:diguanylate cyclase (GGDEF)-like protein